VLVVAADTPLVVVVESEPSVAVVVDKQASGR
jgi:hypothetical protein